MAKQPRIWTPPPPHQLHQHTNTDQASLATPQRLLLNPSIPHGGRALPQCGPELFPCLQRGQALAIYTKKPAAPEQKEERKKKKHFAPLSSIIQVSHVD